jgi:signal transduction histidine kinase
MGQLTVVFEELIANALRFRSPDTPVIEVAVMPAEPKSWLICVTDNGIGLSDADAQRVFQPLAKASDRSGAGIGLTICSHIAKLHGGEMVAVPRPRGAEFRLRLPR